MALKDYNEEQIEQIAYFLIGVLCLGVITFLAYFDLQSEDSISPIIYGGLVGAILRVAIKGFNIATYLGSGDDKEKRK